MLLGLMMFTYTGERKKDKILGRVEGFVMREKERPRFIYALKITLEKLDHSDLALL